MYAVQQLDRNFPDTSGNSSTDIWFYPQSREGLMIYHYPATAPVGSSVMYIHAKDMKTGVELFANQDLDGTEIGDVGSAALVQGF